MGDLNQNIISGLFKYENWKKLVNFSIVVSCIGWYTPKCNQQPFTSRTNRIWILWKSVNSFLIYRLCGNGEKCSIMTLTVERYAQIPFNTSLYQDLILCEILCRLVFAIERHKEFLLLTDRRTYGYNFLKTTKSCSRLSKYL